MALTKVTLESFLAWKKRKVIFFLFCHCYSEQGMTTVYIVVVCLFISCFDKIVFFMHSSLLMHAHNKGSLNKTFLLLCITREWFPFQASELMFCSSPLNPLIPPFIFTFLCFFSFSQALVLPPYFTRVLLLYLFLVVFCF